MGESFRRDTETQDIVVYQDNQEVIGNYITQSTDLSFQLQESSIRTAISAEVIEGIVEAVPGDVVHVKLAYMVKAAGALKVVSYTASFAKATFDSGSLAEGVLKGVVEPGSVTMMGNALVNGATPYVTALTGPVGGVIFNIGGKVIVAYVAHNLDPIKTYVVNELSEVGFSYALMRSDKMSLDGSLKLHEMGSLEEAKEFFDQHHEELIAKQNDPNHISNILDELTFSQAVDLIEQNELLHGRSALVAESLFMGMLEQMGIDPVEFFENNSFLLERLLQDIDGNKHYLLGDDDLIKLTSEFSPVQATLSDIASRDLKIDIDLGDSGVSLEQALDELQIDMGLVEHVGVTGEQGNYEEFLVVPKFMVGDMEEIPGAKIVGMGMDDVVHEMQHDVDWNLDPASFELLQARLTAEGLPIAQQFVIDPHAKDLTQIEGFGEEDVLDLSTLGVGDKIQVDFNTAKGVAIAVQGATGDKAIFLANAPSVVRVDLGNGKFLTIRGGVVEDPNGLEVTVTQNLGREYIAVR